MLDLDRLGVRRVPVSSLAGHHIQATMLNLNLDDAARLRLGTEEILLTRLQRYGKVMAAFGMIAVPCCEVMRAWRHAQRGEAIVPGDGKSLVERKKLLRAVIDCPEEDAGVRAGNSAFKTGPMHVKSDGCRWLAVQQPVLRRGA